MTTKYAKTAAGYVWSAMTWTLTRDGIDTTTAPAAGETANLNGFATVDNPLHIDANVTCANIIQDASGDESYLYIDSGVSVHANIGNYSTSGKSYLVGAPTSGTATLYGNLDGNAATVAIFDDSLGGGLTISGGAINGKINSTASNTCTFTWTGTVSQPAGWTTAFALNSANSTVSFAALALTNAGTVTLTTSKPSKYTFTNMTVVNTGSGTCVFTFTGTGTLTLPASIPNVSVVFASTSYTVTLGASFQCNVLTLTSGTLAMGGFTIASNSISGTGTTLSGTGGLTLTSTGTFTPPASLAAVTVTVAAGTGTVTLGDNFTCAVFVQTSGTTAFNGKTVTCGGFTYTTGTLSGAGGIVLTGATTFAPPYAIPNLDISIAAAANTVTLGSSFQCNALTFTSGTLALAGYTIVYHSITRTAGTVTGAGVIAPDNYEPIPIFRVGD